MPKKKLDPTLEESFVLKYFSTFFKDEQSSGTTSHRYDVQIDAISTAVVNFFDEDDGKFYLFDWALYRWPGNADKLYGLSSEERVHKIGSYGDRASYEVSKALVRSLPIKLCRSKK